MHSASTPELLSTVENAATSWGALAILCLSGQWTAVEQQTFWLASRLRQTGRPVTLVVPDGSVLHERAQAQRMPCLLVPAHRPGTTLRTAWWLGRWLRQQRIGLLLTTRTADLGLATLVKRWQRPALRLLHLQLEALAPTYALRRWWQNWQLQAVDAWLAPLPRLAREVLSATTLEARRLWVVPPALPPCFSHDRGCPPTEARHLLDLPGRTPLIGVLDCGGSGPAFAVEALYRLRQEHGSRAELVIMGGPATPPDAERWCALRQLAQQLRLSHCVHLRPLHNSATPLLFYSALNVLLLPTEHDAAGLPLLNAMASGCPLVSAAAPDTADLLQHGRTAYLFATQDIAACAQLLAATLATPALAGGMAQRATAYVHQHYNPAQQCRQLESILEYVCRHEALV